MDVHFGYIVFAWISHDPTLVGGKRYIRGRILQSYPQLEAADIDETLARAVC
jgi:hypothetical protein